MHVAHLQALRASGEIHQSLETEQHEVWLFNSILLRKEVPLLTHRSIVSMVGDQDMLPSP